MGLRVVLFLFLALPALGRQSKLAPTYSKDIAPILFHRCAGCHRPGEIGPFSLLTWEDTRKRARQIFDVVEKRQMPPWKPEPGYGEFFGEHRVPDAEIELLRAWVDQGSVEGDPRDLPPAPRTSDEWDFDKPDLVLKMPEPYTIGAEERNTYRAFVVPTGLTEDTYVQAFQFRPANRRSVHHALLYLDASGAMRRRDAEDPGPGFAAATVGYLFMSGGCLGAWAPGGTTPPFDPGRAMLVRKGSDLVMQLHFTPTGKEEKEQSTVALWFAKEPPKKRVEVVVQSDQMLFIGAGDRSLNYTGITTLPVDVELLGVSPHAHYLARECKIWATTPEGHEIPIIWIKDWDFDWQMEYRFKEPIRLPKDTRITTRWRYDNSPANPRNPSSPPRDVGFGFRTTDEMALAAYRISPDRPEDVLKLNVAFKVIKRK